MQSPPENTGGTASELKGDAQQLASTASNRLHSEVDARKGTAATQAKSVSSAIERAVGEFDQDTPQWLRSAFEQGASQIRRFADTLEQRDSRQIVQDVQSLARQNPGTFLAGCAALGFAAARVFKAGASDGPDPQYRQSAQFPPVAVDEPMFRSDELGQARSPTTSGEFA